MKTLSFVFSFLFVTSSLALPQAPEVMDMPTSAGANGMGSIAASLHFNGGIATFASPHNSEFSASPRS